MFLCGSFKCDLIVRYVNVWEIRFVCCVEMWWLCGYVLN